MPVQARSEPSATTATAYWTVAPGTGELREAPLAPPAAGEGDAPAAPPAPAAPSASPSTQG